MTTIAKSFAMGNIYLVFTKYYTPLMYICQMLCFIHLLRNAFVDFSQLAWENNWKRKKKATEDLLDTGLGAFIEQR